MSSPSSAPSAAPTRSIAGSVREAAGLGTEDPGEDDIREYAYHLYQQGNSAPGQDLDNWLEAIACLKANIPPHLSGTRLHRHVAEAAGEVPGTGSAAGLSVDF